MPSPLKPQDVPFIVPRNWAGPFVLRDLNWRPRQFPARCRGSACAISAISFLTMMSPNELEFSATMTNAPGPPMTFLR
jgi:hypothetical protein